MKGLLSFTRAERMPDINPAEAAMFSAVVHTNSWIAATGKIELGKASFTGPRFTSRSDEYIGVLHPCRDRISCLRRVNMSALVAIYRVKLLKILVKSRLNYSDDKPLKINDRS